MAKKPLILKKKRVTENKVNNNQDLWRILIVDDEEEIHSITKMILSKVDYKDRKIEFLDAYSAKEANDILKHENDIAVILLDVVMETDEAGLDLVKVIRDQLNNKAVRIILRTGQPGNAPEERVIIDYDINDYKSKNELTARNLLTTVIASLRSYESIRSLERNRIGLEKIIDSTDSLFQVDTLMNFSSGVLTQLSAFLNCNPDGIMCLKEEDISASASHGFVCDGINILGSTGNYSECNTCEGKEYCQQSNIIELARQSLNSKNNIFIDDFATIYLDAKGIKGSVVLLHGVNEIIEEDMLLLSIFSKKIALALANAIHYAEMITAQEAATIDYLTGLTNRRFLIDIGNKLIANCKRTSIPIAVAMIDIDFFKKVNDNYGHNIGDKVLKKIGQFLNLRIRDSDCAARFGGEEFCIIATNISNENISLFFNDIREGISQLSVDTNDEDIKVTVSIGVSLSIGDDIDEMIKAADENLYKAKNDGRNRVVC